MVGLMFWANYELGNYILLSYISQVVLSEFPASPRHLNFISYSNYCQELHALLINPSIREQV